MIDEMKIGTSFMKGLVSKLINRAVKRKLGCNVAVKLNDFNIKVAEEKAHVHLSVDCDMSQAELTKLLAGIGL